MSMPKGFKSKNGYATVTGLGRGYREMAEVMTSGGDKMNHATARNVFLNAMKKIAEPIKKSIGSERDTEEIIRDPRFQEALFEIISDYDSLPI